MVLAWGATEDGHRRRARAAKNAAESVHAAMDEVLREELLAYATLEGAEPRILPPLSN
jgi:hypothetical protein